MKKCSIISTLLLLGVMVTCRVAVGQTSTATSTATVTPTFGATPTVVFAPLRLVLNDPNTEPPNLTWAREFKRRLSLPSFCSYDNCLALKNMMGNTNTPSNTNTPANTATVTQTPTVTNTIHTPTVTATVTNTSTPVDTPTQFPYWLTIEDVDADTPADVLEFDCAAPLSCIGVDAIDTIFISIAATPTFTVTPTPVSTATSTVTPTGLTYWSNFDPSSGDNVVAEVPADTAALDGTSPITITGTAVSDLLTWAWDFAVANVWTGLQTFDAGLKLNDNDTAAFGTGDDATIFYDGTNFRVNPDAVGSGTVTFDTINIIELGNGGGTCTTSACSGILAAMDAITWDIGGFAGIGMLAASRTVTLESNAFISTFFSLGDTWTNPAAETRNFGTLWTFNDGLIVSADASSLSQTGGNFISLRAAPTFTRTGGGTLTVTGIDGVNYLPTLNTGATGTLLRGVAINNFAGSGTATTFVGVDIAALSGSTNIGIRNADGFVETPQTQAITAVGNTITIDAAYHTLTANNSYTLTSAPTIADGVQGEIVTIRNVDTADTITIQDQGTLALSNLRLGANTRALGPRDSIRLRFDSTVGDWVEEGFDNVL